MWGWFVTCWMQIVQSVSSSDQSPESISYLLYPKSVFQVLVFYIFEPVFCVPDSQDQGIDLILQVLGSGQWSLCLQSLDPSFHVLSVLWSGFQAP